MAEPIFTILIVDDEELILSSLSRILRKSGYRVLTTSQPLEVLSLFERESIDILISDIDMPRMSGIELTKEVKTRFPNVVRILITGRGSMASVLQAINEGEVYRYLLKPFEDNILQKTIKEATVRLQEDRRADTEANSAARRESIYRELEQEYPGICTTNLSEGVYSVDVERAELIVAQLSHPKLNLLLTRKT